MGRLTSKEKSRIFLKKVLDKFVSRAIISVFRLSRRYSSVGRATDL